MPHSRDQWFDRIKSIERDHSAARFAMDRLREVLRLDPTNLTEPLIPQHIHDASKRLDGTYLIRVFAEFEPGLRLFWRTATPHRLPTRTWELLDRVSVLTKN